MESLKEDLSKAQLQHDKASKTWQKQLLANKTLSAEQQVAALPLQLEQQEETLQSQCLEESQATQDDHSKTRQRLEGVNLWLEEVKTSKQQVVKQVQQDMVTLQEQRSSAKLQHDEFVQLLQKQQGKEMKQQKACLAEFNRQVQEMGEENQKLIQTQNTRNELAQKIIESLK